jgi:sporulation protein YlmC with PRC-barrel domain
MRENEMDVAYRLLDDELVDRDGRRCGRVDDVAIEGEPGGPAHISAILSGEGIWRERLPRPLRAIARRLMGDDYVTVPWERVQDITEAVHLKAQATELGLGRGDDLVRPLIERIPGS